MVAVLIVNLHANKDEAMYGRRKQQEGKELILMLLK